LFAWLLKPLKRLGALVLPRAKKAGVNAKQSGKGGVVLHVFLVVVGLILLAIVNHVLTVNRTITGPLAFLGRVWLPILGLFIYFAGRVGLLLWRIGTSRDDLGAYPDIEAAWNEAVLALGGRSLDLRDLPLFLILGQTAAGEKALFQAARVTLKLDQTPTRDNVPLHVYANEQGIYVFCPGLSLLSLQSRNLRKTMETEEYIEWSEEGLAGGPGTLTPSLAPELARKVGRLATKYGREGGSLADLGSEERESLFVEERADRPVLSLPRKPDLVEEWSRKLEYLCRLIFRDRHPRCPANGILLLLPLAATASEQVASDTAELSKRDVLTATRGFQLLCPRVPLLCDMETAPGFREFISGFSREKRMPRMGQSCPLAPDFTQSSTALPPEELAKSLSSWVCRQWLPTFIYKEFALEDSPTQFTSCLNKNTQVFAFLEQLRLREKHLGQILNRGQVRGFPEPLLLGGCYIAGTGSASPDQAFVRGILEWLRDNQDFVLWTEEARKEEALFDLWTGRCYSAIVGLGILSVLSIVLILWPLFR
jgi:IcmF-related N-terminal domain